MDPIVVLVVGVLFKFEFSLKNSLILKKRRL